MTLPFPYFLFSGTNGFFLHATNVYLIDDVISTSSSKTNSLGFSRHSSLVWQTMMNRDGDAGIFFLPIFFFSGTNGFFEHINEYEKAYLTENPIRDFKLIRTSDR